MRLVFYSLMHPNINAEYALVAQPKELSEMGYLPIAEEDWPALKVAEPGPKEITGRTGPIRNSRGTRRSTRKVRQVRLTDS